MTPPDKTIVRNLARHFVVMLTLGIVVAGCGRDDPETLWNQARTDWSARRYEDVEAALARLARVRPLKLPERLLRSQVARDRGRVDEAIADLGEVTPGMPPSETAIVLASRGTLELLRHRFRDAEAALLHALELGPDRVEIRRELINLYKLQGRSADFAAQYRALASSDNGPQDFAEAYLWTTGRAEDLGPPELAETLGQAVAADPGDRVSRLALAENLRRLGRVDEASQVLSPLPDGDPGARVARARLALDRSAPDEAEALLAAVPDAGAGQPRGDTVTVAARLRGLLALSRADATTAIRHFRSALQASPGDRESLSGLGRALQLAGDPSAARPFNEAARSLEHLDHLVQNARPPARRQDPALLREIGDACRALSRRDEARAWYRLALARDPLDAELQKLLYQLDGSDDDHSSTAPPGRP